MCVPSANLSRDGAVTAKSQRTSADSRQLGRVGPVWMAQSHQTSPKTRRRSIGDRPWSRQEDRRLHVTPVEKLVIAVVVIAVAALVIVLFSHGGSFPGSLPG